MIDQQNQPALQRVLCHPYLRIWAVGALRQLRSPPEPGPGPPGRGATLGHLGAVAAAAAIRAGLDTRIAVPVLAGAVQLPTLGRLVLAEGEPGPLAGEAAPGGAATGPPALPSAPPAALIEVRGDRVQILAGGRAFVLSRAGLLAGVSSAIPPPGTGGPGPGPATRPGPGEWQAVRTLRAPGLSVSLEDTDFYRDCHSWPAAPRMTEDDFRCWQDIFGRAWQEIEENHPAYAPALAAGLRMIVPLAPGQPSAGAAAELSATSRHAFGAVAIARPADAVTMALLLIHEFQHVKLSAVLDMYDLFDPADQGLYHAPWRTDPRPLEGLLQGSYAHLAVTGFWRARRVSGGAAEAAAARARFAHWQRQTAGAIDTLVASGSLTRMGRWFVGEMSRSIASLASEA
jgi:uncharacterized protein